MMIEDDETKLMAKCSIGYLISRYRTIYVRNHTAQTLLDLGAHKHILFDTNIEESEKGIEYVLYIYLPQFNLVIAALVSKLVKDVTNDDFNDSKDSRAIAFASAPNKEARLLLLNIMSSRDD